MVECYTVACGGATENPLRSNDRTRLQSHHEVQIKLVPSHFSGAHAPTVYTAVDEKESPERLAQFIASIAERGLAERVTPFPSYKMQWQIWTTRDANCNLVQAKKAQDQGNAANASYDPEASMAAWLAANRPDNQEWLGELTLAQGIARQILGAHTATNERDRILTCVQCGQVEITTLNGKHWCEEGDNGYTSSSEKGVYTVHVRDVQQLLQHPQVGLDAWKASKTTQLEQAAEATAAEDTSAVTTGSTIYERVEAL